MTTNAAPRWTRDQDFFKAPLNASDAYIPDHAAGIFIICGREESVQVILGSDDIKSGMRAALVDLKTRNPSFVSSDVCYKFTKSGTSAERAIEVERLRERFYPSAQ